MEKSNTTNKSILIIGGCGYIGSALYRHLTARNYRVDTVDLELFGNLINPSNKCIDYRALSREQLQRYEVVVHLAAHSSVKMADVAPGAALDNNLRGFYSILEKISSSKLIYASSASVYSGQGNQELTEEHGEFHISNMYDFTKHANDCLASVYGKDYYGLRFGTVNGPSPNMRVDLIINSMVRRALTFGEILVSNPSANRSILGIGDLVRAIEEIINNQTAKPGIYNLASFSASVESIAREISKKMKVPIRYQKNSTTYDFRMDTRKFCKSFNFTFTEDISSLVETLTKENSEWDGWDRTYEKLFVDDALPELWWRQNRTVSGPGTTTLSQ